MNTKAILLALASFTASATIVQAQTENSSSAAAPFTTAIQPDARAAAMGGASTALTSGIWATYNNSAAAVLNTDRAGVGYSYVPWQRDIREKSHLNALAGFFRLDDKNALTAGFRHFTPGRYEQWSDTGENLGTVTPREWVLELGYSRRLFEGFAVGATARLVHSDLKTGKPANAVTFDLSALYRRSLPCLNGAWWSVGVAATNFGSHLSYGEGSYSLPGIVKGGAALYFPFARQHELTLAADVIGIVTPSEISECQFAAGAEYRFRSLVSLRGGYHGGNPDKGTGDYFTLGGGLSFHGIDLGVAWLSARDKHNPINNTLTFTLGIGSQCLPARLSTSSGR